MQRERKLLAFPFISKTVARLAHADLEVLNVLNDAIIASLTLSSINVPMLRMIAVYLKSMQHTWKNKRKQVLRLLNGQISQTSEWPSIEKDAFCPRMV